MKVGYVRVSCGETQNTARQDTLMAELQVDKIYTDKMSGKDASNRPQLQSMLDFVREGDVVVSESISRIARSTRDFLSIMDKLNQKGVTYISRKESIDTSTPQGVFMMTVFAALSELERQTTRQRALEGIAEAKKRGVYKGRKPIAIDAGKFKSVYTDWKAGKITAVEAYKKLGISASSWYRRVKDYGNRGATL
ncbi:recombinase family protein [Clostridium sp. P21]|uniref:Recombinase family protein n=1 Tax=Clostridium muellerianum TaxID=2716538 RepID=A0A7Y0ELC0_9CLOT|nr:recombinase family protein [Clostridium muellerianum]NMM65527.1 recombinase family protein [Clostridium muellerianum]